MRAHRCKAAFLILAATALTGWSGDALAQSDSRDPVAVIAIGQNGKLVGFFWGRDRVSPCDATEYALVTPDYIYPGSSGAERSIHTTLRTVRAPQPITMPAEFFKIAGSAPGQEKRIVKPVLELDAGFCGPDGFGGGGRIWPCQHRQIG